MAQHSQDAYKSIYESAVQNSTRICERDLDTLAFALDPTILISENPWERRLAMGGEDSSSKERSMKVAEDKAVNHDNTSEYLKSITAQFRHGDPTFKAAPISYLLEFRLIGGNSYIIDDRRLYFVIRSRKFADVEITVPSHPGHFATFISYNPVLMMRSPYFRRVLAQTSTVARTRNANVPGPRRLKLVNPSDRPRTVAVALPESSFTPKSFSFILGYLYSGGLEVTRQECDLNTAFDIYRGSVFLELPALAKQIVGQILVEILHGLYHAPLSNTDYLQLAGREWSTMVKLGCRCWTCVCRTPRVLQLVPQLHLPDDILERGARRAIISQFGVGWCTQEFSTLPEELYNSILTGVLAFVTPTNVFRLLFEAEKALLLLDSPSNPAGQTLNSIVRARIMSVRNFIDDVFYAHLKPCFESKTWSNVVSDCSNSEDEKVVQVHWVMGAISRVKTQRNAYTIYSLLANTTHIQVYTHWQQGLQKSPIGVQIENMMVGLLKIMMMPTSSKPAQLPIPPSVFSMSRILKEEQKVMDTLESTFRRNTTFRRNNSPASFYSDISSVSRVCSLEEPTNTAYNTYLPALNPANISLYSVASSRTISTDYGVYYTRWAISQERMQD
ncbi:hypothetical protein GALMADRAFT_137472 [Galerina marginata CBS 339.88]|uniref:BTB domain-containing protein n=1 Tax=Galerina marginata (strain CBS 339.88) TaxID=685588 RepID=A0A067TBF3_GALM3|nr:hypothetical protein GALMADRAFT_137472 [Galerina marginata CBS 339.88]